MATAGQYKQDLLSSQQHIARIKTFSFSFGQRGSRAIQQGHPVKSSPVLSEVGPNNTLPSWPKGPSSASQRGEKRE
jgi:hypothetical protein